MNSQFSIILYTNRIIVGKYMQLLDQLLHLSSDIHSHWCKNNVIIISWIDCNSYIVKICCHSNRGFYQIVFWKLHFSKAKCTSTCTLRERQGRASARLVLVTTTTSVPIGLRGWTLTRVRCSDEQLPGGRSAGRIPAGVAARGRRTRWAAGTVFPGGQFAGPDWHVQLERRRRSSSRSRGFRSRKLRPGRS